MRIHLPLLVEEERTPQGPTFAVRPLFFEHPLRRGARLEKVTRRLAKELHQKLTALTRKDHLTALSPWTFDPDVREQRLDLRFELKRGSLDVRLPFMVFEVLEREIAFCPLVPDVWFEIARGEELPARALSVLQDFLRDEERRQGHTCLDRLRKGKFRFRVASLTLDLQLPGSRPSPSRPLLAGVSEVEVLSGADELARVGRCLNHLDPEELDPAVHCEPEIERLLQWLTAGERRPILLVGDPKSGKTALVHETLRRRANERNSHRQNTRQQTWLLSPQRLVSGMAVVGQWENRLHAILREAAKKDHVLYFDDFLGLYRATASDATSRGMAPVIKAWAEEHQVRLLVEMTPEGFRAFQELDRGFADMFHILRLVEPSESDALKRLLAVRRHCEARYHCVFELDVLPTVMNLQHRYAPEQAFPGSAAEVLKQLAARNRGTKIDQKAVREEFCARTGLSVLLGPQDQWLDRESVENALRTRLVGQGEAVHAIANVITLLKAQLNDPGRPLASLLFLGPTGVGKTQCAKAVAQYLFGHADRLVRFDMNEFSDANSAAGLVGTRLQPDGRLTAAIRRQPFSVVLLDEVEKAHPEVMDLLLGVLGEARLTDALGRTASFANCLIILTSNLGAREAGNRLGFQTQDAPDPQVYQRAAEAYFRPEFFNRLDRIIAFHPLQRPELSQIADGLLRDIEERSGLRRRRCVPEVQPAAREWLVTRGHHPQYGARALKRALESQLVQPLARRLSGFQADVPTLIRVLPAPEGIAVQAHALNSAERRAAHGPHLSASTSTTEPLLERVDAALGRLNRRLTTIDPGTAVGIDHVSNRAHRYFQALELVRDIKGRAESCRDTARLRQAPAPPEFTHVHSRLQRSRSYLRFPSEWTPGVRDVQSARDLQEYLALRDSKR